MAFSKLAVLALLALQSVGVCAAKVTTPRPDSLYYLRLEGSYKNGANNETWLLNDRMTGVELFFPNQGEKPVYIESIYGSHYNAAGEERKPVWRHQLPRQYVNERIYPGESKTILYEFLALAPYHTSDDPPHLTRVEIRGSIRDHEGVSYDLELWYDLCNMYFRGFPVARPDPRGYQRHATELESERFSPGIMASRKLVLDWTSREGIEEFDYDY